MDIENKLKSIFYNIGIYVDEDDFTEDLELDSLQFVSLIVSIEKEFLIRISDDILEVQQLSSFKDYTSLVEKLYA